MISTIELVTLQTPTPTLEPSPVMPDIHVNRLGAPLASHAYLSRRWKAKCFRLSTTLRPSGFCVTLANTDPSQCSCERVRRAVCEDTQNGDVC